MAKGKSSTYMTPGELVAGVIFFVVYLLVLPLVSDPLYGLVEKLLDISISAGLRSVIWYYILFAVTIIIFHQFIARTSRKFLDEVGSTIKYTCMGLVTLYGLNELLFRLTNLVFTNRTNLNDVTISAQIEDAPRTTLLIVVFLAPFVEEMLFRGLVFGNLQKKNPLAGYVVSCLLFALLHVWQFAVVSQDMTYFLLMVQYLVPGIILAWVYERSGTLWTSIILHAVTNALAVLVF